MESPGEDQGSGTTVKATMTNLFKKQTNKHKGNQQKTSLLGTEGQVITSPSRVSPQENNGVAITGNTCQMSTLDPPLHISPSHQGKSDKDVGTKRVLPSIEEFLTSVQKIELEAFHAAHPSSARDVDKCNLAMSLGLETCQVNAWLCQRRKRQRVVATGEVQNAEQLSSPPRSCLSDKDPIIPADNVGTTITTPAPSLLAPPSIRRDPMLPTDGAVEQYGMKPSFFISHEEQECMLQELKEEEEVLRNPDISLSQSWKKDPLAVERKSIPFSDATLAEYILCQQDSLKLLTVMLLPIFSPPTGLEEINEAFFNSKLVDMATRRSFAPKKESNNKDALADMDSRLLWQWELRDIKCLPKELRPAAVSVKRQATAVQNRLTAVCTALKALKAYQPGKKGARTVIKALEALKTIKTLAVLKAEMAAEEQDAAAQIAEKMMLSTAKAKLAAEEKARAKAEKDRVKAEKEEEKERLRLEKEKGRAERDAEKERQRREKEELKAQMELSKQHLKSDKVAKRTGFSTGHSLERTASKFMSFFKATTPPPGDAPSSTPSKSLHKSGGSKGPHESVKVERGYSELFLKPNLDTYIEHPPLGDSSHRVDAFLNQPPLAWEDVQASWRHALSTIKAERRERVNERAAMLPGLPATWARCPGQHGIDVSNAAALRLLDRGIDRASLKTYRRKFVWFPADSARPAFYGSHTRTCPSIRPRNFLGKDEQIDYEVMSDLEWEEEPEGSDLMGQDSDEDDVMVVESEVEDSFMVADGYLSEDEGVQLEDEDEEEEDKGGDDAVMVELPIEEGGSQLDPQLAQKRAVLEAQIERARRCHKILIVSRLPVLSDKAEERAAANYVEADGALLDGLAVDILDREYQFKMPENLCAEEVKSTGVSSPGKIKKCPTNGKEKPEELVPFLLAILKKHPKFSASRLVEMFQAAYPDKKIMKSWALKRLKELAEWSGNTQWQLKEEGKGLMANSAPFLQTPEHMEGTGDPYWKLLLDRIENSSISTLPYDLQAAFEANKLPERVSMIPAFIISALVENLNAHECSTAIRKSLLECLREVVRTLCRDISSFTEPTVSQQAWAISRTGPVGVSLLGLCGEPALASALIKCMEVDETKTCSATIARMLLRYEDCRKLLAPDDVQLEIKSKEVFLTG